MLSYTQTNILILILIPIIRLQILRTVEITLFDGIIIMMFYF